MREPMGKKFGMLTILEQTDQKTANAHRDYLVLCDCGMVTVAAIHHLRSGHTTSCGCAKRTQMIEDHTIHGQPVAKMVDELLANLAHTLERREAFEKRFGTQKRRVA